ncbi:MAG: hypothetical protein LBS42_02445 [Tannerella sp.]|jgi:hypothetical protein|nr:hypothetical protein [Tannerella sp.]
MRKIIVVCLLLLPLGVYAQRQTEYNRRGDEAMGKKDYRDAKMWYEEGVTYCNLYSIDQLTKIWKVDETMHLSMRTAMAKCLNCLNELALENDTVAMNRLIVFYAEGVGTAKSESSARYWKNQLEQARQSYATARPAVRAEKEKMNFFIGYHYSPIAPFGIQIGGFNSKLGWYLRLRSDFSFQNESGRVRYFKNEETNEEKIVLEGVQFEFARDAGEHKSNAAMMGSVGMMVKTFSNVYLSVGVGYWQRDLLRKFDSLDDGENKISEFWVKDIDKSKKGVLVDVDAVLIAGKRFYGTAGCSVLNFKNVYPNVGIGVYF